MNLDTIQPNILSTLQDLEVFADVQDCLLIDDGDKLKTMEDQLCDKGISVLIMPPQCIRIIDQSQGAASMEYGCALWVRTNPKVKTDDLSWIQSMWLRLLEVLGITEPGSMAKWNPLILESQIIPAVLQFGMAPSVFRIPEGLEPETDFTDLGNNSRLIRFATPVILQ